jgi:3-methylcrotonyl-CoA carboxylase alpha subunit
MFRKILIANRGEIACRIIATARRLGIGTVAVHSDADADALHVMLADEAVRIGGAAPRDSYLRGDAIIAAALSTRAEAIHPGYGFLSENPDFVEAVAAAGLVFIGPSAQAIRAMGLKDAAKALMARAGVPVVPGHHGVRQDDAHLADAAVAIGYPVLVKAVAGGGGKGMRRVDRPEDFVDALKAARSEARGAFGNDAVLIEKCIARPRHIEVQVFGDGTRAIHLFERDCSLQRRHQKVIEESPAPGMTPSLRAAMGAAAVRAAEAIGYSGAGTVEFIVDASDGLREDRFWFMEMNTRLQVEHPVTEAITGVDLVEWQLRVAAGEMLWMSQDDLAITGHAFEARIYAEDVPAGFLPATGRLAHLEFPEGVRVESGVRQGDAITPWYDPMIAKLVVHGPTRAIALAQLAHALERTRVAGTVTNLSFLAALARHPGVAAGHVDTELITRDMQLLGVARSGDRPDPGMAAAAVLWAAALPEGPLAGFALWAPLRFTVQLADISALVEMTGPNAAKVTVDGVSTNAVRDGRGWTVEGRTPTVIEVGDELHVFASDCTAVFRRADPLGRADDGAETRAVARAPMPGIVQAVCVTAGQAVRGGARLAVLEAMKMEHVLTAPRDGIVAEVLVAEGTQVEAGAALIRMEDDT